MDFDADGKPTSAKLLDLCQARLVTDDIQGIGKVTYHEFSGIQAGKGWRQRALPRHRGSVGR
jgi:hypothetical protein